MRARLVAALSVTLFVSALAAAEAAPLRGRDGILSIDGPITEETAKKLAEAGRAPLRGVAFNSPGGDFFAALKLANFIKARGLATFVGFGATCYSACVVAFQAGGPRVAHSTATFLYHPVSTLYGGMVYMNAAWTKLLKDSLKANGVADALLARLGETPLLLDGRQAAAYGVVTALDGALTPPPLWSEAARLR